MSGPEKRSPASVGIRSGQQERQGQTPGERFADVLGGLHHSITRMKDMQMPVKFWENTVAQLGALRRSLKECYLLAVEALGEAREREER